MGTISNDHFLKRGTHLLTINTYFTSDKSKHYWKIHSMILVFYLEYRVVFQISVLQNAHCCNTQYSVLLFCCVFISSHIFLTFTQHKANLSYIDQSKILQSYIKNKSNSLKLFQEHFQNALQDSMRPNMSAHQENHTCSFHGAVHLVRLQTTLFTAFRNENQRDKLV